MSNRINELMEECRAVSVERDQAIAKAKDLAMRVVELKDKGLYPKKKSASLPTVDVDVCMAAKDRDDAIDKVWKKYGNNTFISSDMERVD